MFDFNRYSDINNANDKGFVQRVRDVLAEGMQFVVQEKVRGSHACFLCDGRELAVGNRDSLTDAETFCSRYGELVERYRRRVFTLFEHVRHVYANVQYIILYGELFGGNYPHADVSNNREGGTIQRGVAYSPNLDFYVFDIYLATACGGRYLSVPVCNHLLESEDFFFARTLFQGSFEACLAYPNAFQSRLPNWLGLPALRNNVCEGIVIRPLAPIFTYQGERILLKSENARFTGKSAGKKCSLGGPELLPLTPECLELMSAVEQLVTPRRFAAIRSKLGEVWFPRDKGKLISRLCRDALDDFLNLFGPRYDALAVSEQHVITRCLNSAAGRLVRREVMKE